MNLVNTLAERQGNCIFKSEDFGDISAPGVLRRLAILSPFGGRSFSAIKGNMAQVFAEVSLPLLTRTLPIFTEGHIQHPMAEASLICQWCHRMASQ
jgi:hypothetical protein